MLRDFTQFTKGSFDLLIIGGGINGAAIANVAAGRGLKVTLLEKNDFASGTSSKSTKLIHGGIRYLENLEFDLVRESLKERFIQLKNVPHLVKPLGLIIPVYKTDRRPLWMMRLGVFLYDVLSGPYKIQSHRSLSVEEILRLEPGIKKEGLAGGLTYYDAQMDDARLVLENVLSARGKGAVVANYIEVVSFIKINGKAVGVAAKDVLSGKTFEARAKKVVCAGGPWTNALLKMENHRSMEKVRLTKGIHIVYKGKISTHALLMTSQKDNRVFFVIPWMGNSLIGTTDTDYSGSPDGVSVQEEDINYLLNEANRVFPAVGFKKENIITTFAGLRPLVKEEGAPSKISRRHAILETFGGILFVMGGKYTTYRRIAQETVNRVLKVKSSEESTEYPLYGSGTFVQRPEEAALEYDLDTETVQMLMDKYGTRYTDVLRLTRGDPFLKARLCSCSLAIKAQVVYALKVEMAQKPEDIIDRRLSLGYLECPTQQCRRVIEEMVKINS